jgi:hypothetical protein
LIARLGSQDKDRGRGFETDLQHVNTTLRNKNPGRRGFPYQLLRDAGVDLTRFFAGLVEEAFGLHLAGGIGLHLDDDDCREIRGELATIRSPC